MKKNFISERKFRIFAEAKRWRAISALFISGFFYAHFDTG